MKTILFLLLLAPSLVAGPLVLVANKKGASFEAELLSATDTTATVRRSSDKKLFSLKLSTLSEDCVKNIAKHRATLKETYPEYEADVVVGKRRRQSSGFSQQTQDVSATVKITNKDQNLTSPDVAGRIVFLGQNPANKDSYEVLATRDFEVSPEPRSTVELELRPFAASYFEENGFFGGDFSGHKYDGYVLILYKKDNAVAHFHTTNSRYKKALEANVGILDNFRTIKTDAKLDKNLSPAKGIGITREDILKILE